MVEYKCLKCGKVLDETKLRKRLRCIYCGSKILYKQRNVTTKVKAV